MTKLYKIQNIEISEDSIRELIKNNPELLKEKEGIEIGTEYWLIGCGGDKMQSLWNDNEFDNSVLAFGNVYLVESERDEAIERRKAVVRLTRYAQEKTPFVPDWSKKLQGKYYVYYNFEDKEFDWGLNTTCQSYIDLPYFKSIGDAVQFIKDNKADLLIVFGVK